jgi:hypothetical protein
MTATPIPRPRSLTLGTAGTVPLALLGTGAAIVLADQPAWSVVPIGGLLLWGVREAGSRSAARRVRGHAMTMLGLTFALAVSMPVFLPPAVDQLMLAVLVAAALVAVIVASPAVRAALRPRRLTLGDLAWWGVSLYAALAATLAVPQDVHPGTVLERAAIVDLVLLVPLLSEVVLRGLLMHGAGAGWRGAVTAALAQGLVAAAFFGWPGLLVGALLGLVLGAIRLQGGWQASLYAHWGLALGLAAPVLTGVN